MIARKIEYTDYVLVDDHYNKDLVQEAWELLELAGQTRAETPYIVDSSHEAWQLTRESLLFVLLKHGWDNGGPLDSLSLRSDFIAYHALDWEVREEQVDQPDYDELIDAFYTSMTTKEFAEHLASDLVADDGIDAENCPLIIVNAVRAKMSSFVPIVQAIRHEQEQQGLPPVRVFITNDNADLVEFHAPPSLTHRSR